MMDLVPTRRNHMQDTLLQVVHERCRSGSLADVGFKRNWRCRLWEISCVIFGYLLYKAVKSRRVKFEHHPNDPTPATSAPPPLHIARDVLRHACSSRTGSDSRRALPRFRLVSHMYRRLTLTNLKWRETKAEIAAQ